MSAASLLSRASGALARPSFSRSSVLLSLAARPPRYSGGAGDFPLQHIRLPLCSLAPSFSRSSARPPRIVLPSLACGSSSSTWTRRCSVVFQQHLESPTKSEKGEREKEARTRSDKI